MYVSEQDEIIMNEFFKNLFEEWKLVGYIMQNYAAFRQQVQSPVLPLDF